MSKKEVIPAEQFGGVFPETEITDKNEILTELDFIHYKYKRLTSLIDILQQFVAEQIDIAGAPEDSLTNALYEIKLGMDENNNRLKDLFMQKGGAA